MRISRLAVKNLRSIKDASLELDAVTPLLGPNGSGKSTWLLALKWFYEGAPQTLDASDFFGADWIGKEIEIGVTFAELPRGLGETDGHLGACIRDDELTVTLRIPGPSTIEEVRLRPPRYFGTILQHEPFASIRRSAGGNDAKTKAALALRANDPDNYGGISLVGRGWPANESALGAWEAEHPELCTLTDDHGQFFVPITRPDSPLHPFTELVTVPAVHDPATEGEAAGSNLLNQLVRLSVRNPGDSEEAAAIQQEADRKFQSLITSHENTDLKALGNYVSDVLERYVPGTEARFAYRGGAAAVQAPRAYVSLSDRGFMGPLDRKGSGLQRLFIVSLIEAAAARSESGEGERPTPRHQILCVEEPELYQHPLQARRFAKTLWGLAADPSHQVLYSTHSPEFLPPGQLASYRLCATQHELPPGEPPASQVHSTTLGTVIASLQKADVSSTWLKPKRLESFLSIQMDATIREGFFAGGIVLVEGAEDAAVINAHSQAVDDPLESHGIAVIPVSGKGNMTRLAAAFSAFTLPIYLIFDSDSNCKKDEKEKNVDYNMSIQKFAGISEPSEFPETSIHRLCAIFDPNLTKVLPRLFPDNSFERHREEAADELGWDRPSDISKNPNALRAIVHRLYKEVDPPEILVRLHESIIAAISGN